MRLLLLVRHLRDDIGAKVGRPIHNGGVAPTREARQAPHWLWWSARLPLVEQGSTCTRRQWLRRERERGRELTSSVGIAEVVWSAAAVTSCRCLAAAALQCVRGRTHCSTSNSRTALPVDQSAAARHSWPPLAAPSAGGDSCKLWLCKPRTVDHPQRRSASGSVLSSSKGCSSQVSASSGAHPLWRRHPTCVTTV